MDKITVTLWPPEHGKTPHKSIEVEPGRVEYMKFKGWRTDKPEDSKPAAIVESTPKVFKKGKKEKEIKKSEK